MKRAVSSWGRTVNLIKIVIPVTPECGCPCPVHLIYCLIFVFQPVFKGCLTQRAMTLSSIFIGNMPGDHTRMVFEFFRQFCIHNSCLFSVYRRCITVVMSFSIQISVTAGIYTKYLRILLCHPSWSCSGRGGKNCRNTIFIQTVNDLFHPFKMKFSLYRFEYCPGKYTQGYFIDFRFFKIFDVFFQNLRAVKPLFRIVISTVEHFSKIYFSCHKFFSCLIKKAFLLSHQGERLFLS